MKKKRFSVLRCFISIICVLFIVVSVGVNLIYSQNKTPSFMGRYFYIVTERDTNGISDVTAGSAIIAKEASDISIAQKDLVLCYPAGDPDNLRLCGIFNIVQSEDGTEKYQVYYDGHEDNTDLITKDKISAICTGYPESAELGSFITFTRSIPGIVAELIIPCLILLVFFISRLSSKGEEDEAEMPDFSSAPKNTPKKKQTSSSTAPLFAPSQEIQSSDELERKKMSIAENFSQKKVNPNSPYQKEKERTMQFKASRPENAKPSRVSPAPSADSIREDIRRKNDYEGSHVKKIEKLEKVEKPENPPVPQPQPKPEKSEVIDNTGIIPAVQISEVSKNPESTRNSVEEIKANVNKSYSEPKKSSSPDISDIISKSEANRRKRNASEMSVDDLLRIIEEEKKKL
ncbi:MAG: hypothetical protein NC177_09735 [Ruminococcus flavefaciens]|nr:hypothetical protein [Ruminococcus flavefaciens]